MRLVAFFRNINQGQRGHPATADLLGAVHDAGGVGAVTFQSNGTVLFEAAHSETIELSEEIQAALASRSGVEREVFLMPLSQVVALVDAHAVGADASRRELTLHSAGVIDVDDPAVVREAARRRCRVLAAGEGWAISANERDRESNATPVVERLTGGPATSRGLPTLIRLVDRGAR